MAMRYPEGENRISRCSYRIPAAAAVRLGSVASVVTGPGPVASPAISPGPVASPAISPGPVARLASERVALACERAFVFACGGAFARGADRGVVRAGWRANARSEVAGGRSGRTGECLLARRTRPARAPARVRRLARAFAEGWRGHDVRRPSSWGPAPARRPRSTPTQSPPNAIGRDAQSAQCDRLLDGPDSPNGRTPHTGSQSRCDGWLGGRPISSSRLCVETDLIQPTLRRDRSHPADSASRPISSSRLCVRALPPEVRRKS